jgi:hypothetical protein
MPRHTDQPERFLEQLTLEELAARFFYVSEQLAKLQQVHEMISRFTPQGRRLRIRRIREWQRKRKHRG